MAGHSRPKDGVLSHAYVPAMTLNEMPRNTCGHDGGEAHTTAQSQKTRGCPA
jgi:hypothetical protein